MPPITAKSIEKSDIFQRNSNDFHSIYKSPLSVQIPKKNPRVKQYFKNKNDKSQMGEKSNSSSRNHLLLCNGENSANKKPEVLKETGISGHFLMNKYVLVNRFVKNMINYSKFRNISKLKLLHYDIIKDLSYIPSNLNQISNKYFEAITNYVFLFKFSMFLLEFIQKIAEKIKVLHPTGKFHIIFDIIMVFNTVLYFIIIPIHLSFNINFLDYCLDLNSTIGSFCFTTSRLLFLVDILVNFNCAYYEKGELINNRSQILKKYIKFQFLKDLLSLIYICFSSFNSNPSFIMKLTSLFYFFRYQNINKMFNRIEEFLFLDDTSSNFLSFLKLIFRIFLLSHIFACIWHIIGNLQIDDANWLQNHGILTEEWNIRYIYSLYFVTVVTCTVGFGDIFPVNIYEKAFCVMFIYLACAVFAYAINSIGIILYNLNQSKREYKHNMNVLNGYLKNKNISYSLRMKLKNYFEYMYEEKLKTSEDSNLIINKLSSSLKEELLLHANGIYLRALPMFTKNFSEVSLRKITLTMKEINMTPGDLVYRQYEIEDPCLYILTKGEIELFVENPKEERTIFKKIISGETFGELSFFTNFARENSARSVTFSSFFAISKEDFLRIIKENDEDFEIYSLIKEEIMMKKNYNGISLKCYSCHEIGHLINECPILNINMPKEQIIRRFLYTKPQKRKKFKRKDQLNPSCRQNARIFAYKLQILSEKILSEKEKETELSSPSLRINDEEFIDKNSSHSFIEEIEDKVIGIGSSKSIIYKLDSDDIHSKISRNTFLKWKTISSSEKDLNFFEKAKKFSIFFPQNNCEEFIKKIKSKRQKKKKTLENGGIIPQSFFSSVNNVKSGNFRERVSKEKMFFKRTNFNDLDQLTEKKNVFNFMTDNPLVLKKPSKNIAKRAYDYLKFLMKKAIKK